MVLDFILSSDAIFKGRSKAARAIPAFFASCCEKCRLRNKLNFGPGGFDDPFGLGDDGRRGLLVEQGPYLDAHDGLVFRPEKLAVKQKSEIIPHVLGPDLAVGDIEPGLEIAIERMPPIPHDAIADVEVHGILVHQGNRFLGFFSQQREMGQVGQGAEIVVVGSHHIQHVGGVLEMADQGLLVLVPVEYFHVKLGIPEFLGELAELHEAFGENLLGLFPLFVPGVFARKHANGGGPQVVCFLDTLLYPIDARPALLGIQGAEVEFLAEHPGLGGVADPQARYLQQGAHFLALFVVLYPPHLDGGPEIVLDDLLQALDDRPLPVHDLGEGLEMHDADIHVPVDRHVIHAFLL
ncbi:hypothetical protein TRIP_E210012 [uncultured Spirochaetota bacterium]|uniref:Uncharacterized protein n=1 Tax=uncultured Spirochaetota bacterium TaxID=460511 RepID=A0A652ZV12_9SPIR|nr:hypothetical protein TRIP_E210012 [uncultured Spirochaetota bacterium]